jgi:putative transposase
MDVDNSFCIPDELWNWIEPLVPQDKPQPQGGRPRMEARQAMTAIFYILRTGCQWKALPRALGAPSTVYDRFREWEQADVFETLWQQGLCEYDAKKGIDWKWQSVDGCMTKAPLGGEAVGPNPTDRAKSGTKRSLLTEGAGIPLAVAVDGANRHDKMLLETTLNGQMADRPDPAHVLQNLCLDKGYDYPDIRELAEDLGYVPHIKTRGEEIVAKKTVPKYRARRWVVERSHSWINRFRRLLIRWEKRVDRYLAFLHFACAIIVWRATGVFG